VVEFLGLPGAGKSTLAREVIELLAGNQYETYNYEQIFKNRNITRKWSSAFIYYCKNFGLVFYLLLYTLFSSPINPVILKYNIGRFLKLLELIVMLELSRRKINLSSLMIFDQGIIQCTWSITSKGGGVNKKLLKKALSKKKQIIPDIIVYVDIQARVAAARIKERDSKTDFDHLTFEKTKALFRVQACYYRAILETIKEVKDVTVLVVDGNAGVRDNIDYITAFIKDIIEETVNSKNGNKNKK